MLSTYELDISLGPRPHHINNCLVISFADLILVVPYVTLWQSVRIARSHTNYRIQNYKILRKDAACSCPSRDI